MRILARMSLDLGVGYQAGCQLMRALVHGFLAAEHAAASG